MGKQTSHLDCIGNIFITRAFSSGAFFIPQQKLQGFSRNLSGFMDELYLSNVKENPWLTLHEILIGLWPDPHHGLVQSLYNCE